MSPMPHIECPNCGSDWVTPIVYGLPGDELIDMAMQRYVTLGGCTVDGSESMWSCECCHHEWGSLADETNRQLRDAVFAYIDSVIVPASPETRHTSMRERCLQSFVDTVVLQTIVERASAIHLEPTCLAFVIDDRPIAVSPARLADGVIEAFQNVIKQNGESSTSNSTVTVMALTEYRVVLGFKQLASRNALEIRVLDHDLPSAILGEISPRQRVPVCPRCGKGLQVKNAKQCFTCGMDWRDSGGDT